MRWSGLETCRWNGSKFVCRPKATTNHPPEKEYVFDDRRGGSMAEVKPWRKEKEFHEDVSNRLCREIVGKKSCDLIGKRYGKPWEALLETSRVRSISFLPLCASSKGSHTF
jgi:hypothetical protein